MPAWFYDLISRILARHLSLPAVGAGLAAVAAAFLLPAGSARGRRAVPAVHGDHRVASTVALHPLLSSCCDAGGSVQCMMDDGFVPL